MNPWLLHPRGLFTFLIDSFKNVNKPLNIWSRGRFTLQKYHEVILFETIVL